MSSSASDKLYALRKQYLKQLPAKLEAILDICQRLDHSNWQIAQAETLHLLLHGISGSAGSFGMQSLSVASNAVENRFYAYLKSKKTPSEAEWVFFKTEVKRLHKLALTLLETSAPNLEAPKYPLRLKHSPLVYLVEDNPEHAENLGKILTDDGFRVRIFLSTADFRIACASAETEVPATIIMDMIFPEGDTAGAVLISELRKNQKNCPPVMFVSARDDLAARLAAFRAGASRYMTKPVVAAQLIDQIDELTNRQPLQPYRILMVDDDTLLLELQANILRAVGMEVRTLSQPLQIIEELKNFTPDVVVLDVYMPEASGPELAAVLREREEQVHVPILFLSAETDMSQQLLALNLGGDDFLVKPVQPEHLVAAVTARARRARQNSTVRKRLETTLYEREREHLALNQHGLVSLSDELGRIIYANDNFCEISGYTHEELLGQDHRILKSGMHTPEFYQTMWRTLASGNIWQGEICNRKKDGSYYWVLATITPFLNAEGVPYQYVSIRTDITALKASQTALSDSEERWRFALEGSGDVVWDWNIQTGKVSQSPTATSMFGYEKNETGDDIADWNARLHPADQLRWKQALKKFFKSKTDRFAMEYRVRCKDGSYKWILTRGMVISRTDDNKISRMIGVHTDINERKLSEEQRKQIQEYLQLQIERMPTGYIVLDKEFRIQIWNPAATRIFGYTAEEALGKNPDEFIIPPESKSMVKEIWMRLLNGDEAAHSVNTNITKDGRIIVCEWTNTPLKNTDGKTSSVLSMVQDITAKQRAELELAESEKQLKEAQAMAHIGSWHVNPVTGEGTWSDENYRILGLEPNDIKASPQAFFSMIHPEDIAVVQDANRQAAQHGYAEVTHRIVRRDNSVRYLHERMHGETDSEGRLVKLTGVSQDITDQVQAAQQIEASQERLRRGQMFANIGTWDWNIQTGELHWTERIAPLFGYPVGELDTTYDNFIAAIHPDDRQSVIDAVNASVEKAAPYEIEHRVVWPDGTVRWLLERGAVARDADGKPLQMLGVVQDIDDKKRAELALAESRKRLVYAHTLAKLGYWSLDLVTQTLNWSEEVYAIFGLEPQTFNLTMADYYKQIVHPDDLEALHRAEQETLSKGIRQSIDHRFIHPDGSIRWVHLDGEAIRDASGKINTLTGTVQDINDRKHIELELLDREQQLREAQTMARIGTWTANIMTGELVWSDEIYRIFGHEPGSFTPSVAAFHAATHPEDRALVQASEDSAKKTGQHNVVHRIVWPDGTVRYVHELAQAETDTSGNLTRLSGTVQDISERVESEKLLRESEAKLSGLFELSPLGIVLTDMQGRFIEFNEAFRTICGYPSEELFNLDYWTLTPRKYEEQEAAQLESLAKTGRYGPYEKEYRQKDGTLIPIRLNGILVTNQSGVTHIWSIVEDITDSKITEQALITASEEANRANQAKSEFLSSMSHELRTPMNAILGFGQLLQYDENLSGEQKDSVQEIVKAGDHLLELINEVLDLAKVESGRISLSLEPVELCSVIEECFNLIGIMAEKHNIEITHVGLKNMALRADRTRLKQVLLNLLSNAIKYNRKNGKVHLDVKAKGSDRIHILVTDTGPGIPEQRMHELFKPFNRLDAESSNIEGTGIGLTISRRLVELMGGSLDVTSEVGVGSTFWIELPIESHSDMHTSEKAPPEQTRNGINPLPHKQEAQHTVLYIEDNPSNLRLMAQILGRRQHIHLLTAHTPELGMELASARHPELILLDINMPGMDGYIVLNKLKADAELKNIPVIAVTANAMPRDIEQGLKAGFNNYLTKPIDVARLYAMLDELLQKS